MNKSRTDLSRYDNSWYKPGNKVRITLWFFTNAIIFASSWVPVTGIKVKILRLFGAKVGKGVVIKPSVNIKYPWFLEIGDHVWIGENVWIDNLTGVKIGNNVCISQGAMLLTGNHNYKKITFDLFFKEIELADGVWIGARSVVCPGCTCDSHSILTVGSVLTSNMESYGIYSGNPATKQRERDIKE